MNFEYVGNRDGVSSVYVGLSQVPLYVIEVVQPVKSKIESFLSKSQSRPGKVLDWMMKR